MSNGPHRTPRVLKRAVLAVAIAMLATVPARAEQRTYKMTTPIPPQITTPDKVETRIGTLRFFDGVPTEETATRVYDQLDFSRGIEAFLNGIPGASMVALRTGSRAVGAVNGTIGIFQDLMDSRSLYLTANTESIYYATWIDLRNGPIVIESPPGVLGVVNDFWFRYVADLGNAGPDKGKGGKYLILPPDYKGTVPKGYFTFKSPTYGNLVLGRGFMKDGSTRAAVDSIRQHMRVYPLAEAGRPHAPKFVELSGREMNTVHANDFSFFSEVDQIIQEEPEDSYGPDMMGIFNAIGLVKGQPFAPDARMKKILTDAVATGNAIARSIDFRNRAKEAKIYPDAHWNTPFIGGSYEWLTRGGARNFDARTLFFYAATVNTPAMAVAMPGVGSQYATANLDASGQPFDGAKTYRLRVPAKVPVKDFWSVVLYDTQTRSMLQTDQRFPSLSSQTRPKSNPDGSVDVYFSPERPANVENWVQTVPGKSWFTIFRLYGPLQPWFDKSWKLPDIQRVG
ncbi:DUF1254 domain-containing protein [Cupriavidus alkaliphilus]|uniref:DUF1254 domain-containing protein n=1 Tax=Cupriavidus alkaliphilus TaxID=942866 RepID=UPI000815B35D|nr:DUF1254 domain-containing protein [Cupriavidus alkaliphilus]SCB19316.1 Uncharacterized conserved protein [Cupriavidus alkaliphilus]